MKRGIAVLLAGVLALGMSMTAMASESVEAEEYVEVSADDVEVVEGDAVISYIYSDNEDYEAVYDLYVDEENDTLAEVAGVDGADYELAYLFDADGEDLTFAIYIDSGYDDVIVLHYDGEAWEVVESVYDAESGYLEITTGSYSPFAIYVSAAEEAEEEEEDEDADDEDEDADDEDEDADEEDEESEDEDADEEESEGTSDATGEGTYVLYLVAIAALAGLAVSSKMRRA